MTSPAIHDHATEPMPRLVMPICCPVCGKEECECDGDFHDDEGEEEE